MSANEKQVGGEHYKAAIQHWDYVAANELDYFQAQITKYVTRWKKKNGLEDLKKAQHFLEKYIELNSGKQAAPTLQDYADSLLVSAVSKTVGTDNSEETTNVQVAGIKFQYPEGIPTLRALVKETVGRVRKRKAASGEPFGYDAKTEIGE